MMFAVSEVDGQVSNIDSCKPGSLCCALTVPIEETSSPCNYMTFHFTHLAKSTLEKYHIIRYLILWLLTFEVFTDWHKHKLLYLCVINRLM